MSSPTLDLTEPDGGAGQPTSEPADGGSGADTEPDVQPVTEPEDKPFPPLVAPEVEPQKFEIGEWMVAIVTPSSNQVNGALEDGEVDLLHM